jgi:hypothetical protein
MEQWSNGMMGLKEFFTIKMVYFRFIPNIPVPQLSNNPIMSEAD